MLPTHVGMNRPNLPACRPSRAMLPTHVGMNRRIVNARLQREYAPHTRGDEPAEQAKEALEAKCSPHTWG